MAIISKKIPKTTIFLESSNPLVRFVETEFFTTNNQLETFRIRTNLLIGPIPPIDQDADSLELETPVITDVNNFAIIFKPLSVGQPVQTQNYAFPIYVELLNYQKVIEQFPPEFEELQ